MAQNLWFTMILYISSGCSWPDDPEGHARVGSGPIVDQGWRAWIRPCGSLPLDPPLNEEWSEAQMAPAWLVKIDAGFGHEVFTSVRFLLGLLRLLNIDLICVSQKMDGRMPEMTNIDEVGPCPTALMVTAPRHLLRHDPMPVLGLLSLAVTRGAQDVAPNSILVVDFGTLQKPNWFYSHILSASYPTTKFELNWLATYMLIRSPSWMSGRQSEIKGFWHRRLSQLSRRSLSKDLLSTEAGNVQLHLWQLQVVDVTDVSIKSLDQERMCSLPANFANSKRSPILNTFSNTYIYIYRYTLYIYIYIYLFPSMVIWKRIISQSSHRWVAPSQKWHRIGSACRQPRNEGS